MRGGIHIAGMKQASARTAGNQNTAALQVFALPDTGFRGKDRKTRLWRQAGAGASAMAYYLSAPCGKTRRADGNGIRA
ncbi:MAG: hypothetical protein ACLUOI_15405 [Eisenbergiella sp.]